MPAERDQAIAGDDEDVGHPAWETFYAWEVNQGEQQPLPLEVPEAFLWAVTTECQVKLERAEVPVKLPVQPRSQSSSAAGAAD